MREINKIIIHCSATIEGQDFDANDIDKWHKEKGWTGIGYHKVIRLNGEVQNGRAITEIGAHALGHNDDSIGIVYIGGLDEERSPKDTRTQEQLIVMRNLCVELLNEFDSITEIKGHNELPNVKKACPCFDVSDWLEATQLKDVLDDRRKRKAD